MRMFRNVVAVLLAAFLVTGLVNMTTVGAGASSLPERIIDEQPPAEHQVTYDAFRLRGKVTEPQADGTVLPYADQQVKILKKACGKCNWKIAKKVKTDSLGVFKTRIYAPDRGKWRWRSKVDHSNGFSNTKGKIWTLYFAND